MASVARYSKEFSENKTILVVALRIALIFN